MKLFCFVFSYRSLREKANPVSYSLTCHYPSSRASGEGQGDLCHPLSFPRVLVGAFWKCRTEREELEIVGKME